MFFSKQEGENDVYKWGALGGAAEVIYIFLFALIMTRIGPFMNVPTFLALTLFLLLFVFSAGISGFFVLGYPTYLALQKKYKEAAIALLISFLVIFCGMILAILINLIK